MKSIINNINLRQIIYRMLPESPALKGSGFEEQNKKGKWRKYLLTSLGNLNFLCYPNSPLDRIALAMT
jgi:hypothetical protein